MNNQEFMEIATGNMNGNIKILIGKMAELDEVFNNDGRVTIRNLYSLNNRLLETIRAVEAFDIASDLDDTNKEA